jgi:uncharacterized protein (DUF362 family)
MVKSIVSISKGFDADRMVHEAVEHLGGIGSFIGKGSTVVIKPNAGHEGAPGSSVNTSPEVVKAVIMEVKKASPGRIILAESSAIGCDTMTCLEVSGIKKAAEEAGVDEIIDIKKDRDLVEKQIKNPTSAIKKVMLPRFLLEADNMVNVPIFKSHVSMVFSCALKNLKGVVQDVHHYVMHTTNLSAAMMDLGDVFKPDLTIADLIRPMEGFGPHSGTPREFGALLASSDMVALDATACRLVGLDLDNVDYFRAAREKGLGNFSEEMIEIRGVPIAELAGKLYLPYLQGFEAWPEYRFHVRRACSTCQGLAAFTMVKLKSLGEYEKNRGLHYVLGRHAEIPEGALDSEMIVLQGDCTKALKSKIEEAGGTCLHVPGCPPGEPFPAWAIIDREDQPSPKASRERLVSEDARFRKWLKEQSGQLPR